MRVRWEVWVFERLMGRERCLVEPGMSCIPLRGDTICRRCYEALMELEEQEWKEEMERQQRNNTNTHKEDIWESQQ
jgi:hypothetical protein